MSWQKCLSGILGDKNKELKSWRFYFVEVEVFILPCHLSTVFHLHPIIIKAKRKFPNVVFVLSLYRYVKCWNIKVYKISCEFVPSDKIKCAEERN